MIQALDVTPPDPPDLESAYNYVRSYVQGATSDLRRSAAALEGAVQSLAGLPGRKALVYVSSGLPMRPGEELYQHLLDVFGSDTIRQADRSVGVTDPSMEMLRENQSHLFNSIVRQANAHQVTFYTIDARGSGGESSLSAEYVNLSMGSGGVTALDTIRNQGLQEPLLSLAEATGGTAIVNTTNFDGALAAAARDFDSFYSLGYRSPHGGDGAYRDIEVRLSRPNLQVRHRTGFVDKPLAEQVADRTLSSLLLELGANPLDVAVDFGKPTKEGRGRYVLPVLARVPIRGLTLIPQQGTNEGRLRFYVVVKDAEEGVSKPHDEVLPVSIPGPALAAARQQDVGWGVNLLVREGLATIAVGVWDELSGLESFVHKEVRVGPMPKKGR
jgi:VWFA-related protein